MKYTREQLVDMLDELEQHYSDELQQQYLIVERYRRDDGEKQSQKQKEKILNIFEELIKGE